MELTCKTCKRKTGIVSHQPEPNYECDTCRRIEVLETTVTALEMRINAIEEREQTR